MKYIITLNNKKYEVNVTETEAAIESVTEIAPVIATAPAAAPVTAPVAAPVAAPASAKISGANTVDGEKVTSPMPGTILDVKVSVGQSVSAGDIMFILEAMKMESEIVAPVNGAVKQILVSKGSTVETDEVLAVI